MAQVSNSDTSNTVIERVGTVDASEPDQIPKWRRLRKDGADLIRYLLDCEVHTYAFSAAANAILSFIPFMILLYKLSRDVFHSPAMFTVVNDMVSFYFPVITESPNWMGFELAKAASRHGVTTLSLVLILISCTGIFLPLEVALNQAWGVKKSRNYIMNQIVAFGLAILMVILGLISIVLNAAQQSVLAFIFFHHVDNVIFRGISYVWLTISSGSACILFLFCVYWLLPNRRVPWRPVMRTAIYTGLVWLVSKYIFLLVLPHLDLSNLYGPFYVSVSLLLWAYVSGMILFAGAQFSASRMGLNGNGEEKTAQVVKVTARTIDNL